MAASKPKYYGKYRAYVVDVNDPLKMGRIRVDCPKITGGLTQWCMPCIQAVYDNGGDFHFPKIGETVFIEFEDGDFKYPIYTGGWFKEGTNPLPDYDPDLRIISWNDNIIYMEKNRLTIKNVKSEVVLNNADVEIKAADNVSISGSKNISVQTPSQISINSSDSSISLQGKGVVNLRSGAGLTISAPDCDMTFSDGEMHFNSSQGDIDVTESGIEIDNKSGSSISMSGSSIVIDASSITLRSEHNEIVYD